MKLILRLTAGIIGLTLTATLVLAGVSSLTRQADERFEAEGAYSSDIVTWEQSRSGSGLLTVLGHPLELDLTKLGKWADNTRDKLAVLIRDLAESAGESLSAFAESSEIEEQPNKSDTQSAQSDVRSAQTDAQSETEFTQSATSACTSPRSAYTKSGLSTSSAASTSD